MRCARLGTSERYGKGAKYCESGRKRTICVMLGWQHSESCRMVALLRMVDLEREACRLRIWLRAVLVVSNITIIVIVGLLLRATLLSGMVTPPMV